MFDVLSCINFYNNSCVCVNTSMCLRYINSQFSHKAGLALALLASSTTLDCDCQGLQGIAA